MKCSNHLSFSFKTLFNLFATVYNHVTSKSNCDPFWQNDSEVAESRTEI